MVILLDLDANMDGDVVLIDPLAAQTLQNIFEAQKQEELLENSSNLRHICSMDFPFEKRLLGTPKHP